MRKLIIIRPGKHVGLGRTAGGRDKCQVAEFSCAQFLLSLHFYTCEFRPGETLYERRVVPEEVCLY